MAYARLRDPDRLLGDRIGARRVLIRVVLWWSFFTAATGWVWNFWSLFVVRFLFGAGEAGCFPNIARAFSRWLPLDERVRAQGILWMSARWGGAITPLLLVLVLQYVNWRRAFGCSPCSASSGACSGSAGSATSRPTTRRSTPPSSR